MNQFLIKMEMSMMKIQRTCRHYRSIVRFHTPHLTKEMNQDSPSHLGYLTINITNMNNTELVHLWFRMNLSISKIKMSMIKIHCACRTFSSIVKFHISHSMKEIVYVISSHIDYPMINMYSAYKKYWNWSSIIPKEPVNKQNVNEQNAMRIQNF